MAFELGADNAYFTNGDDLKKRSTKFKKGNLEFECYDKNQESRSKDNASTRLEWRNTKFKIKDTPETRINDTIQLLDKLVNDLPYFNFMRLGVLYQRYLEECELSYEGRITSLQIFVTK